MIRLFFFLLLRYFDVDSVPEKDPKENQDDRHEQEEEAGHPVHGQRVGEAKQRVEGAVARAAVEDLTATVVDTVALAVQVVAAL